MRYVIYCKLKTRSYLLATESTEKNLNIKNEGFDLIREFRGKIYLISTIKTYLDNYINNDR